MVILQQTSRPQNCGLRRLAELMCVQASIAKHTNFGLPWADAWLHGRGLRKLSSGAPLFISVVSYGSFSPRWPPRSHQATPQALALGTAPPHPRPPPPRECPTQLLLCLHHQ